MKSPLKLTSILYPQLPPFDLGTAEQRTESESSVLADKGDLLFYFNLPQHVFANE